MKISISSPIPCTHCGGKIIVRKTYMPTDFLDELEEVIINTKCRPCEKLYNQQCKAFSKLFELECRMRQAKLELDEATASFQQRMNHDSTAPLQHQYTLTCVFEK